MFYISYVYISGGSLCKMIWETPFFEYTELLILFATIAILCLMLLPALHFCCLFFSDIHLPNRYLLSTYYILSTDLCLFIVYSFYAFFFPVFCLLFKKSICSLLSQSESFILEQEDLNYLCLLLIVLWVKLLLSAYFVFWIYAPFVFLCFLYFTL